MKVTLPYDPTWQALEWAKKHCPSYITNKAESSSDPKLNKLKSVSGGWVSNQDIVYYFGDQYDAMIFKLRWA